MGFADAYLLKAGLREALIEPAPHPELNISVTIPVYNESGLERCLDSLFQCGGSGFHAEVLILINAPAGAPTEVLEQNQATLLATRAWISAHPHPSIDFYVWLDHSFGKKEAGVGTARKILMDEAVRRFNMLDRPQGIVTGFDADAVVESNYLEAVMAHFKNTSESLTGAGSRPGRGSERGSLRGSGPDGCSIRFEHPLSGAEHAPEVFEAITLYELHLRYYLQALRSTLYPYAYHTVGSSMAVRADIYCKEGGMNRRQAGEDFYFIQKLAQRGNFSQCNSTCVRPSPRPSDRVPFGTGRAVSQFVHGEESILTYHPEPFRMLASLFSNIDALYSEQSVAAIWETLPGVLTDFLETQKFTGAQDFTGKLDFTGRQDSPGALLEIRDNSASPEAFRKRFWRWFNMFRIMKFLHFARERGYPDVPVGEAASAMIRDLDPDHTGIPSVRSDPKKLLLIYRMLEMR